MSIKLNEQEVSNIKEGIKSGIIEAFKREEISLSERDEWIIELSVKTTFDTLGRLTDITK